MQYLDIKAQKLKIRMNKILASVQISPPKVNNQTRRLSINHNYNHLSLHSSNTKKIENLFFLQDQGPSILVKAQFSDSQLFLDPTF